MESCDRVSCYTEWGAMLFRTFQTLPRANSPNDVYYIKLRQKTKGGGITGARRISQRIFLLSLYCIYYHRLCAERAECARARAQNAFEEDRVEGRRVSRRTGIIILRRRATEIRVGNRVAAVVRKTNVCVCVCVRDEGEKKRSEKKKPTRSTSQSTSALATVFLKSV